jgi:hypothetical protein
MNIDYSWMKKAKRRDTAFSIFFWIIFSVCIIFFLGTCAFIIGVATHPEETLQYLGHLTKVFLNAVR